MKNWTKNKMKMFLLLLAITFVSSQDTSETRPPEPPVSSSTSKPPEPSGQPLPPYINTTSGMRPPVINSTSGVRPPVTNKDAPSRETGPLTMSTAMFKDVLMNLKTRPVDGAIVSRTLKEKQFTAEESQDFLKTVIHVGPQGLGSLFNIILNEMWAKYSTAIGGIKNLDFDAPLFQNNTLIFHMPEGYYKSLSDSQFEKMLSLAYNGTNKTLEALFSGQFSLEPVSKSDLEFEPKQVMSTDGYRHICKRLFSDRPKGSIITKDFLMKSLVFMSCAPVDVCENIPLELIDANSDWFNFLPITCSETMNDLQKDMVRLYPGARPCLRAIVAKVASAGNVMDVAQKFEGLLSCTSSDTMIKHMTSMPCETLVEFIHAFPKQRPAYYISKYQSVNFKPLDKQPTEKTLVNKCFTKSNAPLTRETLGQMGSLVTKLSLKSVKEISKEDLAANFDSIKQGIQSEESTTTTTTKTKNAAVREIVKKLTQESGDLSTISDCNSCIQSLSVRDLKSTLKSNNTADMLTSLGLDKHDVQFTDSQAKFLAKKVIGENITSFTADKYREMKSIVKGLVSQDMEKIAKENKNNSGGLEIATVFCEQTTWPSKTLQSIRDMIMDGLKYRNASNPMKALTAVDVAGFGCECLMNFAEDQLSSMDPLVCADVCQKVGKCDNFVRINTEHRKKFSSGCMKCQNLSPESFTADTIETQGSNLLAQLTPAQVALLPNSAFQAMYDKLPRMCLSPELAQAVTNKLATLTATGVGIDDMYKLSSAMYLLPATAQASLNQTVLKTMAKSLLSKLVPTDTDGVRARKECEQWLDDAGRAQLKDARFKFLLTLKNALMSSTARKKRSATGFWTCSNIQAFLELFVMATVSEIELMSGDDFKTCIMEIGTLNWNTEQKTALKAKNAAYNVSTACDVEDIGSIGTLAQALTATEIDCLNLNDSTLVSTLGKSVGWTATQYSALASGVLTDRGLTTLAQSDLVFLSSLGAIMCGFQPQVIKSIPPAIDLDSSLQFSLYSDCTTSHLVALKEVVSDPLVYGPPGTWTAATTNELIYVIGGLTGPEIKTLSRDAIEGITTASIPVIPGNVLKEMSIEQLSMFSDRQAVAVTATQKLALSSEQVRKLTEIITGQMASSTVDNTTGTSVGAQVAVSLFTMLVMLMTSALILL